MREVLVLASSSLLFLNWLDSSCTILPASRLEHMPVIVLVFQLGGVLKFTIEGPQIHWKNVIFRKSRFLQKQDRLSLAYLGPQRKIREEKQNNPHSSQQVSKKRFLRAPLRERSPTPFPSRQLNSNPGRNIPLPWLGFCPLLSNSFPYHRTIHSGNDQDQRGYQWKIPFQS